MKPELHDLLHALVEVEKHHIEMGKWIEITNKFLNEMILNDNSVLDDGNSNGSVDFNRSQSTKREGIDG